jgi:hypothetical protein
MFGATVNMTDEYGDMEALLFFHGLVMLLMKIDMSDVLVCKVNVYPNRHTDMLAVSSISKMEVDDNPLFKYITNMGNGHGELMQAQMRKEMEKYPALSIRVEGDVIH